MPPAERRPPRIAVVTPMLPVPHDPTRGRYIHETARSLSKLCDVRVFFQQLRYLRMPLASPRSYLYARMPDNYSAPGINVETLEYPAIPGLTRPLNSYLSARRLLRPIAAFRPDLIIGYWIYPDGHAALLCARKLRVPCVIGALGSDIHVRDRLNAWFTRRAVAGSDALITVSEAMRRTAIETFNARPERTFTVINGFNTSVFHRRPRAAMRAKLGIAPDAKLIVYVGRLIESKGLRELLTAFAKLADSDPSYQLAFVGSGVMETELRASIDQSPFKSRILMPGGLEPEQVAEWIAGSNVLCLPSWSEGYPNVLVEALACGRPVVATDVGGTREIVTAEAGFLVRPKDPDGLAVALRAALSRDWDEDALASLLTRTWDDVAADTLRICSGILSRRTSASMAAGHQPAD